MPRSIPDPPARPRLGPRPLALHLGAALTTFMSARAGLTLLKSGSPLWNPGLADRAAGLRAALDGVPAPEIEAAVEREARRRLGAVLSGIERYRRHPYRRDLPDPPAIWTEGASRLLDYGPADGAPVLLVPSLVNRHYVLDLSRERSFARWLARQGMRPLLLDWGRPGDLERRFTLTDYVAGRLCRLLDALLDRLGRPLGLVGYCMGGMLAAALAERRPEGLSALVLLAAPWDFHAEGTAAARRMAGLFAACRPMLEAWGEMPTEILQALFASLDPGTAVRKFERFGHLDPDGPEAAAFVALEDWLNDGVPLPGPVAVECLAGWYGANDPARGRWRIDGRPVDPRRIRVPVLAVTPARDRIVPPASARALARLLPDAETLEPPLGHIGMMVSAKAPGRVWEPVAGWLGPRLSLPARRRAGGR